MPDFLTPKPGDSRNITPNGTTRSAGGEQRNGWLPSGNLGTDQRHAGRTLIKGPTNTNRTGEGGNDGY